MPLTHVNTFPLKRELNGLVQTSVNLAVHYPCNIPNGSQTTGLAEFLLPAHRNLLSDLCFALF